MEHPHPLIVTLESGIFLPEETKVFRARERSVHDDTTLFFGTNVKSEEVVVEVRNENIRAVVDSMGSEVIEADE